MDSAGAIDDTVAGEIMHSCRAKKVVDGSRRTWRPLALREDVVFFLDEISQTAGSKLRSEDLPYTPDAEKVDFGPPPVEVCDPVSKGVPPVRKGHSICTVWSLFRPGSGSGQPVRRLRGRSSRSSRRSS